jgi:nucleoid-associated protein YgaU
MATNLTELIAQTNLIPTDINAWFKDTSIYNDGTNVFYANPNIPAAIPTTSSDVYYTVQSGDLNRMDLVSYKFYQTPFLWWAILLANNIVNPFNVKVGDVLRIPTISTIRNVIIP